MGPQDLRHQGFCDDIRALCGGGLQCSESHLGLKMKEFYLTRHTNKIKGHQETLGGVRHVSYLDCGDGATGVCIYPNSST